MRPLAVLRILAGISVALAAFAGSLLPPAGAVDAAVAMVEVRFDPEEVRIAPGDTVTWTNEDGFAHTVVADDGSWDSSPTCQAATGTGCIPPGGSWSRTFPTAGRFTYHCDLHGGPGQGMTGVVVVG